MALESEAFSEIGRVSIKYPKAWEKGMERSTVLLTPEGEDSNAVNVKLGYALYSETCVWDDYKADSRPFKEWVECHVHLVRKNTSNYSDVSSPYELGEGDVQLYEATNSNGNKVLIALVPSTTISSSSSGVGRVEFEAIPRKFDEYKPTVMEMLKTFQSADATN